GRDRRRRSGEGCTCGGDGASEAVRRYWQGLVTGDWTVNERKKAMVMGAAPAGARDQASVARAVREMFSSIAPRYDLLNHLLSFNLDRWWWWQVARTFEHILSRPEATVLDLCCGTGDMAFALRRRAGLCAAKILGADFAHPMREGAAAKSDGARIRWVEADALTLPLADASFDLVT